MKNCHVCNFECEDNAELCPICGADLNFVPNEEEEVVFIEPVLLGSFDDVVLAEIFCDILIENKIPFSKGEEGEVTMKVLFGGGFVAVDIYVDKKDFDKANELYLEFLNNKPEFEDFFDEELEEEE